MDAIKEHARDSWREKPQLLEFYRIKRLAQSLSSWNSTTLTRRRGNLTAQESARCT